MLINTAVLQEAKDSSEIENIITTYKDANRVQITALAGLDPKRKKISKSGNKIFRKILYFPMLTAIRYNEKIRNLVIGLWKTTSLRN